MVKILVLSIILLLSFPYLAASSLSPPGPKLSGKNLTEICSIAVDPTFCVDSLESDPRTTGSNLYGIANISIGLAMRNTTVALGIVESLAGTEADPVLKGRFTQCTALYKEAVKELGKAGRSVGKGDYGGMGEHASMALEKSEDCTDAFAMPPWGPLRLTESNRNVQLLCNVVYVIAVAIVG